MIEKFGKILEDFSSCTFAKKLWKIYNAKRIKVLLIQSRLHYRLLVGVLTLLSEHIP